MEISKENKHLILNKLFIKVFIKMFEPNIGMIIKVDDYLKPLLPNINHIIIYNNNGIIDLMVYSGEDIGDGTIINLE